MKNITTITNFILTIALVSGSGSVNIAKSSESKIIEVEDRINNFTSTISGPSNKKEIRKTNKQFLNRLGYLESKNRYNSSNIYNYVGKYQFGKYALEEIGYNKDSIINIRSSTYIDSNNRRVFDTELFTPQEQEICIRKLMHRIEHKYLKKEIKKYDGKVISGIWITKAGILAAAHLKGYNSIRRFLNSNGRYNPTDAFGTSIKEYLQIFEHYKLIETF